MTQSSAEPVPGVCSKFKWGSTLAEYHKDLFSVASRELRSISNFFYDPHEWLFCFSRAWNGLQDSSASNVTEPDKCLENLLLKHDFQHFFFMLLLSSSRHESGLCEEGGVCVWGGFCLVCVCVCDKSQLFTTLHLTYSLTPRSLSPTPTSPCSPCSPLHAFHFWR